MFVSELTDDGLVAEEVHQESAYTDAGDGDVHVLPGDLEGIAPGPFLASVLSVVDPGRLVGRDVVRYVQAQARLVSHYQAFYYTGVSELAHATQASGTERAQIPNEFASDELAAAVTKTRRAAQTDFDFALDLQYRLPRVCQALATGRLDLAKARVFSQELATLKPELIPDVVDKLIVTAEGLTTGQLRTRLKTAVLEADHETAQTQYQAGLEDRKLVVYPNPDHTATLLLSNIAPEDAIQASKSLHAAALRLKRLPGETRTIDQLKADVAIDLLRGKATNTSGPHTTINIQRTPTDPTTHVTGYGPILTTSHQALLNRATNITAAINQNDQNHQAGDRVEDCHQTNSRQPTKSQIQHIHARYPTCIHPGCRIPADQCDLDHRQPWHLEGKTSCTNLAPLCHHHHRCKDQGDWRLQRNHDNSHTWTSPLGHTYTTPTAPP